MTNSEKDRREMTLMAKLSLPEASAPPWSLLSAALTVFVMLIFLVVVGPALASLLLGSDLITPFLLTLSWTLGMALTILFVLVNRRSTPESWRAVLLRRGLLPTPIALLLGVAIALAIDLIISLGSGQFLPLPEIFGFQSQGSTSIFLAALLLILLQPLAESLVFQAVMLPALRWKLGPWGGVFATSALFTVLHLLVFSAAYREAYDSLWYGIIYPALTGCGFCLLRVYSQSSGAVIISRMGAGLIFFLTALALMSG